MTEDARISIDPAIGSGKPCIRGTRITVKDVLEYLAGGMTEGEGLADFPSLRAPDIAACRGWAAGERGPSFQGL